MPATTLSCPRQRHRTGGSITLSPHHRPMCRLNAIHLFGIEFVVPCAGLAAAKEWSSGALRTLPKPVFTLLPGTIRQSRRKQPRAGYPHHSPARRRSRAPGLKCRSCPSSYPHSAPSEPECRFDRASFLHDCSSLAPFGEAVCTDVRGYRGVARLVVYVCDSPIDADPHVIGERGRHIAWVAHDQDRAAGAAQAGE